MDWYSKKENKETLYIPVGVKNRKEYFSGFGKEEMFAAIKASFFVIVAAVLVYIVTGVYLNSIMLLIAGITVIVIMLTKTDINISAVDTMRFIYDFYSSQQIYPYVYKNEFVAQGGQKRKTRK